VLEQLHTLPEILILKMDEVITMDASALHALESLHRKLTKHDKCLILSGPHTQPYFLMHQGGLFDAIGRDNVAASLEEALMRARALLAEKVVNP
jgi:SulP family sulfate permease